MTQPQEIAFLGIQTAPSQHSASFEFPIAIGMGFPDTKITKKILIRPNEEWDIFNPIRDDSDKRKGGAEREEYVSKYRKSDLLSRGLRASEAARYINDLLGDRTLYGLWQRKEIAMLRLLFSDTKAPSWNCGLKLFNQFVSFEQFISLELRHKLTAKLYPMDGTDVRWMIACLNQCLTAYDRG